MNSFISRPSISTNVSQNSISSAVAGFYGSICLNMKDFRSLDECVNKKSNFVDSFRLFGYKLFLYQMHLLFIKNLTFRHYNGVSPHDFNHPDNQSILGAQFLGEIDYGMIQTVFTYQRSQIVKYSTPFKFGYLCFFIRRPEVKKDKSTSK